MVGAGKRTINLGANKRCVNLGGLSVDEFFASFAYKPSEKDQQSSCPPNPGARGDGETGNSSKPKEATTGSPNTPSQPPPPPPCPCPQRKRKPPRPFQPSSFLRTTVNGKPLVVSRFFPLPPGATPPVPIDQRVIDRAKKRMMLEEKRMIARERKRMKKAQPIFIDYDSVVGRNVDDDGGIDAEQQQPQELEQELEQEEKKEKRRKTGGKKQRSLLSAAEKMRDAYKRVGFESEWEAPSSPYKLLQERHAFDPWRVLIICMLLNLTTGEQVKKILPGLFLLYRDAEGAVNASEEELVQLLQPLGLHRKRARAIKRFSEEYLGSEWTHVTQLPGVGKYAADAYAIFCAGRPDDVVPEDHKLVPYWKFACEKLAADRLQSQQQSPLPQ